MKANVYNKIILIAATIICVVSYIIVMPVVTARAETSAQAEKRASVTIIADGERFTYTDAVIEPSDFTVAEQIETRAINARLERKLDLVDTYLQKGADYKTALGVCFPLLPRTVEAVAEKLYVPPTDAEVKYKNGKFTATKEHAGERLDESKLYAGIYYCLKFTDGNKPIKASTVPIAPAVTQKALESALCPRGEYTTVYSSSTPARAHNVTLALTKFDGAAIAAGGTMSFNATVGARTKENGFKDAKIIVDGKYVDGVGGGVCQASTAVYNAALLSGLGAAANAHSICPSYCQPGLDAMISACSDLVITNTTSHTVYISVAVGAGAATVRFVGEKQDCEIVPESVVTGTVECEKIETIDSERKYFDEYATAGDRLLVAPGKDGIKSETYLKYYKNGVFYKRVKIRQNEYKPTPQIVMIAP